MKEKIDVYAYYEHIRIMNPEIIPIEQLILIKNYCDKSVKFTFCDDCIEINARKEHLYTFLSLLSEDYSIELH